LWFVAALEGPPGAGAEGAEGVGGAAAGRSGPFSPFPPLNFRKGGGNHFRLQQLNIARHNNLCWRHHLRQMDENIFDKSRSFISRSLYTAKSR